MLYLSKISITAFAFRYIIVRFDFTNNERSEEVFVENSKVELQRINKPKVPFNAADNLSIDESARQKVCHSILPSRNKRSISSHWIFS